MHPSLLCGFHMADPRVAEITVEFHSYDNINKMKKAMVKTTDLIERIAQDPDIDAIYVFCRIEGQLETSRPWLKPGFSEVATQAIASGLYGLIMLPMVFGKRCVIQDTSGINMARRFYASSHFMLFIKMGGPAFNIDVMENSMVESIAEYKKEFDKGQDLSHLRGIINRHLSACNEYHQQMETEWLQGIANLPELSEASSSESMEVDSSDAVSEGEVAQGQ